MRIAILGNAGAGKTTLARALAVEHDLPRLALDDLVWRADRRRVMRDPSRVDRDVDVFVAEHERWVVEGVYSRLIRRVLPRATRLIWLDVDPAVCAARVRRRPLPPDGWRSPEERDRRLTYVVGWAATYGDRDDRDSRAGHRALFDAFDGLKERRDR